ncbi:MAG: hypothetical protein K6G07_02645 [Lachnospiraceae bacterium]|nr:hypothetical protein [Lachnospiraceae bacterium]
MRKRFGWMLALSLAVALIGCGAEEPSLTGTGEAAATVDEAAETPEVGATDADGATDAADAADATDESGELADANNEESESMADIDPDTVYKVENNGGYFVKVGDYVYYRLQGPKALNTSSIGGMFLNYMNETIGEDPAPEECGVIRRLDPVTMEQEDVVTDIGCGPIFSDGKYLYLSEYSQGHGYVKYVSLSGKEEGKLCGGSVVGCDEASGLLAVNDWDSDTAETTLYLYRDMEKIGSYSAVNGYEVFGVTEHGLYFMEIQDDYVSAKYYEMSAETGEVIELGTAGGFDYAYPCAEQFLYAPDGVYFVMTGRDGSAAFVSDVVVSKATPGQAGSLTDYELPAFEGNEEFPVVPELYLDDSASVQGAQVAPGKAMLGSMEEGGDLLYTYAPDEYTVVLEPFRLETEKEDYRYIEQAADVIDEKVYIIISYAHRDPENDIGWRESYALDKMEYICVPLSEAKEYELATVEAE